MKPIEIAGETYNIKVHGVTGPDSGVFCEVDRVGTHNEPIGEIHWSSGSGQFEIEAGLNKDILSKLTAHLAFWYGGDVVFGCLCGLPIVARSPGSVGTRENIFCSACRRSREYTIPDVE